MKEKEMVNVVGSMSILSKAKPGDSCTVSHVAFILKVGVIRCFTKKVNWKYCGNSRNSEYKYSQYLLTAYHMLDVGPSALHV